MIALSVPALNAYPRVTYCAIGKPSSVMHGTSGVLLNLSSPPVARIVTSFIEDDTSDRDCTATSMCPPRTADFASEEPSKGTTLPSIPVFSRNSSAVAYALFPVPEQPMLNLPGFAFPYSIASSTVWKFVFFALVTNNL